LPLFINKTKQFFILLMLAVTISSAVAQNKGVDLPQKERDNVLSLAALAMVYKDWQTSRNGRGHNIGSILVDQNSTPVFWARNSVVVRDDSSQHGEVRLIQAFLNCPGIGKYMDGYTIYTSLEPCAMCTGMIAMTKVNRVVYVQDDPEYGHARQALVNIKFPRLFEQKTPKGLSEKSELEQGWATYSKKKGSAITDYLLTDEARTVYAKADQDLNTYKLKYPQNESMLLATQKFIKDAGPETFDQKMMERCPKP